MSISSIRASIKRPLIKDAAMQRNIEDRINRITQYSKQKQQEKNAQVAYLKKKEVYQKIKTLLKDDVHSTYGINGLYRVANLLTEKTALDWSVCLLNYGAVIFSDYINITVCLFFAEDKDNAYYPAEFNYNKHPMAFNHIEYITKYYYQVYHEHYKSKRTKQIEREELKHREKLLAYLYQNEE